MPRRKKINPLEGGLRETVSSDYFRTEKMQRQLKIGTEVELEHTRSRRIAKKIAKDHLIEIPDYYDRLKKMEKEGEKYWKKKRLIKTMKEVGKLD